ncbi:ferrochelatase [Caulochytrium protostelioides]|nr:ferrochelatase [Caulochytrium protostelioides]
MGGPADQDEVYPFLFRLFSDHDLIPLPFQKRLAPWIARRRTPSIKQQYAQMGGGSPIRHWTERQGQLLCAELDRVHPATAPHKPYVAFRYAQPLSEVALEQMKRDGVRRAVALSCYPQYSCSTTGSSLNELHKQLMQIDPAGDIAWQCIDRWPTHPGLVEAFAQHVEKALEAVPEAERANVPILFSAHSLPMTVVNRGDPYPQEVAATVHAVMARLQFRNPYRLVWQSQVGPQPWLGPQTADSITGYGKQGQKHLLLVPIAFVSDHIETLYELDVENQHLAAEAGVTLHRAESLNDSPVFIDALVDLVRGRLAQPAQPAHHQLGLRCPQCTNPKCAETKAFFQSSGPCTSSESTL